MKGIAAAVAIAICLGGCQSAMQSGKHVESAATQPGVAKKPAAGTLGRWRIERAEMTYSGGGYPSRSATNTILLDSETGHTWLLWPTTKEKRSYVWVPLEKQTGQFASGE